MTQMLTLSLRQAEFILRRAERHLHLIQFRVCELQGEIPSASPSRMYCKTLDQFDTEMRYIKKDYNEAISKLRELESKAPTQDKMNSNAIIQIANDLGVDVHQLLADNVYERKSANILIDEPKPAEESKALDWDALNHDLVIECERAIRQRDRYMETGVSTASHGGTHDTCFEAILRKHLRHFLR